MFQIYQNDVVFIDTEDLDYFVGSLAALQTLIHSKILKGNFNTAGVSEEKLSEYRMPTSTPAFAQDMLDRIALKNTPSGKFSVWIRDVWDEYRLYIFNDPCFIRGFANLCRRFGQDYLDFLINCCYDGRDKSISMIFTSPVLADSNTALVDMTTSTRNSKVHRVKDREVRNNQEFPAGDFFVPENEHYV